MVLTALASPVVHDGRLDDDEVSELLGFQTEYPDLDYKRILDLSSTHDVVELAKDVGAMQVLGGYIVVGVDDTGVVVSEMDAIDTQLFDESRLRRMMLRFLPEPLTVRSRVLQRDNHTLVLLYVAPHPSGCAIFHSVGQYQKPNGNMGIVFRPGDVFWRNGTSSERINQQGFEQIIARRLAIEKSAWREEQNELHQAERAQSEAARDVRGSLGSVDFDMPASELAAAALELVRSDDQIATRYLLNDALRRARLAIERDEIETELADVLDKLCCMAATFLAYGLQDPFRQIVDLLVRIHALPVTEEDERRFAYSTYIDPRERGPRVWLQIVTRIFAVGALAVRERSWESVRYLALQRPERMHDYDTNWIRHAVTMVSRAQHLSEAQTTLISLARTHIGRLDCLRPDGIDADGEDALNSLLQFDVLWNLAAIDAAGTTDGRVFYPSFARYRESRIEPLIERLLTDTNMRQAIFVRSDADLALALRDVGHVAHTEGMRYNGFWDWDRTPIATFITENLTV